MALLVQILSWTRPIVHSWVYGVKMEVPVKPKMVAEKFQISENLRVGEINGKTRKTFLDSEFI